MPNVNAPAAPASYSSRWFIWTIVFLVVTGISLVSYIVLSETSDIDTSSSILIHHNPAPKTQAVKTSVKK